MRIDLLDYDKFQLRFSQPGHYTHLDVNFKAATQQIGESDHNRAQTDVMRPQPVTFRAQQDQSEALERDQFIERTS